MVRSHAEWEMIIKEAYASELPLKRWCREHDINYSTFNRAKRKLLEKGKLQFMEEKIQLPETEGAGWLRLSIEDCQAFIVLNPIRGNLSFESMTSIIWFDLNLPLIPGQMFFFISKNWKQIYALKICRNGYCLYSRKLEYGTFYWPVSHCYGRDYMYRYEYDNLLKAIEN